MIFESDDLGSIERHHDTSITDPTRDGACVTVPTRRSVGIVYSTQQRRQDRTETAETVSKGCGESTQRAVSVGAHGKANVRRVELVAVPVDCERADRGVVCVQRGEQRTVDAPDVDPLVPRTGVQDPVGPDCEACTCQSKPKPRDGNQSLSDFKHHQYPISTGTW